MKDELKKEGDKYFLDYGYEEILSNNWKMVKNHYFNFKDKKIINYIFSEEQICDKSEYIFGQTMKYIEEINGK